MRHEIIHSSFTGGPIFVGPSKWRDQEPVVLIRCLIFDLRLRPHEARELAAALIRNAALAEPLRPQ